MVLHEKFVAARADISEQELALGGSLRGVVRTSDKANVDSGLGYRIPGFVV